MELSVKTFNDLLNFNVSALEVLHQSQEYKLFRQNQNDIISGLKELRTQNQLDTILRVESVFLIHLMKLLLLVL